VVFPVAGGNAAGEESVGSMAYSVMFDSVSRAQTIDKLIKFCSEKNSKTTWKLPSHESAIGVLSVREFSKPLGKMQETILTSRKDRIFRTKCHAYSRSITSQRARMFSLVPSGKLDFVSSHEVNGNFKSRFAYKTRTEWVKSQNWLLEKEDMLPGAKQIRGRGGRLDELRYFTILAAKGNRTLRITASWCKAGGKLPVIGQVRANYHDIAECMSVENRDIQRFLDKQTAG